MAIKTPNILPGEKGYISKKEKTARKKSTEKKARTTQRKKDLKIGKIKTMPASFLRSSEYIGCLSVHIGLTRNSVFISSRDLSSSSVSLILFVSDEEGLENSSAMSTPVRIDLTLELSSWFRLSMIWDLKG